MAIFRPEVVHIGHDEVRHVHPFPATPAQAAIGFPRLLLEDVTRLHDHLAARGVATMLWGDELLSPDVAPLLSRFPGDMQVAVWNYQAAGSYPQLATARAAGFATLGASWSDPDGIDAMARAAEGSGAEGLIQTRWTGYFGNAAMLASQYSQVYAYVTAAAAAWDPGAPASVAAPAWFRAAWAGAAASTTRSGALISLTREANTPLDRGFLGLGPGYAMTAPLKAGGRFGGIRFDLSGAIAVRGDARRARDLPTSVEVPVGRTARTLVFLHATGWNAAEGDRVGSYEVVYVDGTRRTIPLLYDRNIACWTQLEVDDVALEQAWRGTTPNGLEVALFQLRWRNPDPALAIDHVQLVSAGGIATPVLFGLTLVD